MTVCFEHLSNIDDSALEYAVVVSRYRNQWVYCKHKARDTWEIPGGHREPGEPILQTARRELCEETGAIDFELAPVCAYSVAGSAKGCGLLCFSDIVELGRLPALEIERIALYDDAPELLTYPLIQPVLFEKVKHWLSERHTASSKLFREVAP